MILPHMRTTNSVCRILKSMEVAGYLHSTKKKRYPLMVNANGTRMRPAFIAVHNEGVLDIDIEKLIQVSEYSQWFTSEMVSQEFIPIAVNGTGQTAYQQFDFEKAFICTSLQLDRAEAARLIASRREYVLCKSSASLLLFLIQVILLRRSRFLKSSQLTVMKQQYRGLKNISSATSHFTKSKSSDCLLTY